MPGPRLTAPIESTLYSGRGGTFGSGSGGSRRKSPCGTGDRRSDTIDHVPPLPQPAFWPASLHTDRLLLRPIERADVAVMSELWTDPEVRRYLGGPVAAEELPARERGCVGAVGAFSVLLRTEPVVIGSVLVESDSRRAGRAEVSYQLLPEHWGRGYGREAVTAAISWALDEVTPARPEVVAVTQEANARSRRLLESVGMTLADHFVEWGEPQVLYARKT
ncbi:GNAT family N-acetyltransferase [Streptomyces sp. ISL-98]|nr:GNAT family N-acetyltransferase [Streptomyces sp. ISL-98]